MKSVRLCGISLLAMTLVFPSGLQGDSYVIPSAASGTDANSSTTVPLTTSGRTYQMQIAQSELSGIAVGSSITGLRWRYNGAEANSLVAWTFNDYRMTLGEAANAINAMSDTFADNISGSGTTVYSGSLSLSSSFFSIGSSPNAFSDVFTFTTPHVYTGGDLVIHITHTGNQQVTTRALDGANSSAVGYGSAFRALRANSFNATTAIADFNDVFVVTQLEVTPVPEAEWACLGTGLLLAGWAARRSWGRRSASAV